jgi:hypothetical protein
MTAALLAKRQLEVGHANNVEPVTRELCVKPPCTIQIQVVADQGFLRESIQALAGAAGVMRLEAAALSDDVRPSVLRGGLSRRKLFLR